MIRIKLNLRNLSLTDKIAKGREETESNCAKTEDLEDVYIL